MKQEPLPTIKIQTCMRRGGDINVEILGPHGNERPVAFHRMTLHDAIELNLQLTMVCDEIIAALNKYRSGSK